MSDYSTFDTNFGEVAILGSRLQIVIAGFKCCKSVVSGKYSMRFTQRKNNSFQAVAFEVSVR